LQIQDFDPGTVFIRQALGYGKTQAGSVVLGGKKGIEY